MYDRTTKTIRFELISRNPDVNVIIYGVTEQLIINSSVRNIGETAYQPKMTLQFHSDLDVDNVKISGVCVIYLCMFDIYYIHKLFYYYYYYYYDIL